MSPRVVASVAALVVADVALFVALLVGTSGDGFVTRVDVALARALARDLSDAGTAVFSAVTHAGDEATLFGVVLVVAAILLARRASRLAACWVAAAAGNAVLNPSLKQLVGRIRPDHDPTYAVTSTFSFPSGHTSGSIVVYGMLAYVLMRSSPRRAHPWIVVVATLLILAVASSRVALRVHWASDVLAGFASGSAWLALSILATHWFLRTPPAR